MDNSVFSSNTYGIGQLITQKKRLQVPPYQRDYSWGRSEVEQFLDDILTAVDSSFTKYFLGSIVMIQPREGIWSILDGQQRITTVSMIYSAIRNLLIAHNKVNDAEQIANEFLGVRILGGNVTPRLLLNTENKLLYNEIVVDICLDEKLSALKRENRSASNVLLLNAVIICRKKIKEWLIDASNDDEAVHMLYQLASYLELNTLVVTIEVAEETDAFIAFETLNTRGLDLSALDLVKNYIYGKADTTFHEQVDKSWAEMKLNIGDKQADDFLRIFWMGNFGLIQRASLYDSLKRKFNTKDLASELAEKLAEGSYVYSALEDAKHEFWQRTSPYCKHLVGLLNLFKSKQTRPVLYSCLNIKSLQTVVLEEVLWSILVLTIRFQTIGKKRQGILEKHCARMAEGISAAGFLNISSFKADIEKILPPDEEFFLDFSTHQETVAQRSLYFLAAIEAYHSEGEYHRMWKDIENLLNSIDISVGHILPKHKVSEYTDDVNAIYYLGNQMLVTNLVNQQSANHSFEDIKRQVNSVPFITTAELLTYSYWNVESIKHRQEWLAEAAVKVWRLNSYE